MKLEPFGYFLVSFDFVFFFCFTNFFFTDGDFFFLLTHINSFMSLFHNAYNSKIHLVLLRMICNYSALIIYLSLKRIIIWV